MTTNSIPVYRHGRKFYVSPEEYDRLRSEEQRQRRTASQKSQHLPVKPSSPAQSLRYPSASSYNPIHRSQSNPYDYKYGFLKTPHIPINSLVNTNIIRRATARPSRSILKNTHGQDDLSSNTSSNAKRSTINTIQLRSSEKTHETHRNSISSDNENDVKRSFSAEISQLSFVSPQQKQTSTRRPIPTTISDYGMSPLTSYSVTPNDQSYTQTVPSKVTNYFAGIKQSSLNPPSSQSTDSFYETGIQGSDHIYSVLGSSNRQTNRIFPSVITQSKSDNSKNPYSFPETVSGTSFSDDNSSSLLNITQRRNNTDLLRSNIPESTSGLDDDYNQSRDLWTRSTDRSQSSDGLLEKKHVRFADMEGLTLETVPIRNQLTSVKTNRLLNRRPQVNVSSEARGQARPFSNTFYHPIMKTNQSKLATDV